MNRAIPKAANAHRETQQRSGAALIMALVVLAIVSLLTIEQVRRSMADRRQERVELLRVQTGAAADAAVRTALQLLRADAGWNGAVWDIPAAAIPGGAAIQVEVKVQDGIVSATAAARLEDSVVCRVTRTEKPKP